MKLLLFVLVLVPFCGGQTWQAPAFCHNSPCPQFKVVEKKQDFEERLYVASQWITSKLTNTEASGLMAANSRLKNVAGQLDSWPVLITVTNENDVSLSWFVPPGTQITEISDPSVQLQSRPEVTVYVRVFNGTPSIESARDNAEKLCAALREAGKTCTDPQTYAWAGYESYFSPTHHNEVWIDQTQ